MSEAEAQAAAEEALRELRTWGRRLTGVTPGDLDAMGKNFLASLTRTQRLVDVSGVGRLQPAIHRMEWAFFSNREKPPYHLVDAEIVAELDQIAALLQPS
jgi:hypothetical protein